MSISFNLRVIDVRIEMCKNRTQFVLPCMLSIRSASLLEISFQWCYELIRWTSVLCDICILQTCRRILSLSPVHLFWRVSREKINFLAGYTLTKTVVSKTSRLKKMYVYYSPYLPTFSLLSRKKLVHIKPFRMGKYRRMLFYSEKIHGKWQKANFSLKNCPYAWQKDCSSSSQSTGVTESCLKALWMSSNSTSRYWSNH